MSRLAVDDLRLGVSSHGDNHAEDLVVAMMQLDAAGTVQILATDRELNLCLSLAGLAFRVSELADERRFIFPLPPGLR